MAFRKPLPQRMPQAFAVADAVQHGMTKRQLRNPSLGRPFFGTRTAPGIEEGLFSRCLSLATRMSRGQAFSHVTAARLHGVPLPPRLEREANPLHVMSPAPVRALRYQGAIGHQARVTPAEITLVSGLPVTAVERTWCDLAAILSVPDLVAAGDYLLCWENPKTTTERLRDAVAHYPSQRGRSALRPALEVLSPRSRSRPESLLRVALVTSPLPDPAPNFEVHLALSRRYLEIDLAYPKYKVGLEYQGDHHRQDRGQWRRDIRRGNDAVDEGWSMLYFTGDDTDQLGDLLARVERRLRSRGWAGGR
ncbi:MAG: hypothetical protein JWP90_1020 [Mycetocola sp.]|nr:hypothetical protein [Mycetocola sp.]